LNWADENMDLDDSGSFIVLPVLVESENESEDGMLIIEKKTMRLHVRRMLLLPVAVRTLMILQNDDLLWPVVREEE
jgi:hypothetical protein